MKKNTFCSLFILIFFLIWCKGKPRTDAEKTAGDIQSVIKEHAPGTVVTSETGFYMKATINGKE